jgi:hypothetical protein
MNKKIKSAPPDPPFGLDMPFDEAMKRFIGADPKEVEENIKRYKKKKPPSNAKKALPGGSQKNVVSLRSRRMAKRNNGR